MQHFIGTYECKADAKGRIMLPAALKKQLSKSIIKVLLSKGQFSIPVWNCILWINGMN